MIQLTLHIFLPMMQPVSMLSSASYNALGFECMSGWVVDVSYSKWHFLLWSSQAVKHCLFLSHHCSVLLHWWHISS
jgi:hypothetical protein